MIYWVPNILLEIFFYLSYPLTKFLYGWQLPPYLFNADILKRIEGQKQKKFFQKQIYVITTSTEPGTYAACGRIAGLRP